jgi:hypothetical protein
MEVLCTICCKEKRTDPGLLPAVDRYRSERIAFVHRESLRLGKPLLIFSGKFGLLPEQHPIPWYDIKLTLEAVPGMVSLVSEQIEASGVTRITFYGHPATDPDWLPYIQVLQEACRLRKVQLDLLLTPLD